MLDGAEFVSASYRTLLGRAPDTHGLAYYLGRLARGYDKAEVIVSLATSPEALDMSNIRGIAQLISEVRRSQHWFWGWFGRGKRIAHPIRQLALVSVSAQTSMQQLSTALRSTQEDLRQIARPALLHASPSKHGIATQAIVVQRLSEDEVRQAFYAVLGRQPSNSDVIAHHANYQSPQHLRNALMHSDEFRNKVEGSHAKLLLGRMCQVFQ